MKVVSVSVGGPREVPSGRQTVLTSIFKRPVDERVATRGNSLAGDTQSDLAVHGGKFKAIYAYPSEHYAFWRERLPGVKLADGSFGENLTTEGLLEDNIYVGDRFRIGSTELVVTQPRIPCFKLGIRFGRPEIVKEFLESRRSGFYFSIAVQGEVAAGDRIELIARDKAGVTIREILDVYLGGDVSQDRLRQIVGLAALSDSWRDKLRERIVKDVVASDIRICFVGDSLVNGTGDETALGWTGRVSAAAHAQGHPFTYYNLGVRGETTRDIRLRWERECAVRLPQSVEGRIVLSCGVNDAILDDKGGTRVRFEESVRNLTQILKAAVRYQRLVVGPPPVSDGGHSERIAALSNAFAHEMASLGLPYVDLVKPLANDAIYLASLRAGDGYHPTSVGYVRMADAVKASPAWWFK